MMQCTSLLPQIFGSTFQFQDFPRTCPYRTLQCTCRITLHIRFPLHSTPAALIMPPPPTPTQSYAPNPTANFFNTVLNPNALPTSTTPPRPARPFEPQAPQAFTATQRSLQARNKNYNTSSSPRREREAESYESRQRREEASRILESTEMVIWLSNARNEVCYHIMSHMWKESRHAQ